MTKDELEFKAVIGTLTVFLIALALWAATPLALFWSINVLFGLDVPLTGRTWWAAIVLVAIVRAFRLGSGSKGSA